MKILSSLIIVLICLISQVKAQGEKEDVPKIIDDLTIQWENNVDDLTTYDGLGKYCRDRTFRTSIISLLNKIHHYDTVLYNVVTEKFAANQDSEAKATLDDIVLLEVEYTTKAFLKFLHQECNTYNEIENNLGKKGGKEYETEAKKLTKELTKYVTSVTSRIKIIDEHVHHLTGS